MNIHNGHPDPNLLACLADGRLTASERDALLDHLSCCRACRESAAGTALPGAISKPEWRRGGWHLWAGVAAMLACFLAASLWHRYPASPAANRLTTRQLSKESFGASRRFEHLRLTRSFTRAGEPPREIGLLAHLIRRKPRQNQLIVFSPYGERWLTLESTWSLPASAPEPPGTVN